MSRPKFVSVGTRFARNSHELHTARVERTLVYWAAVFFVIALLSAFLGFGGLSATAEGISKILFFVFLVLAVVSFIFARRVST